jgi:dihydrofolate reductase
MRKVILWIGMSFDGFTSGPDEKLDWLVPYATAPEGHAVFRSLRERSDTVLVGRVNYEGFARYWPAVQHDPKASETDRDLSRWLDAVPKIVFSRTLREVNWKSSRLATGTPREEIGKLKASPGKDIIIQNSTRLAQSLLAEGLVDELVIVVAPILVGAGRALFANLPKPIELGPVDVKRFESGAFLARYEVKHG